MDEADRLLRPHCHCPITASSFASTRLANLKNSIPGSSVIEAQFLHPPASWQRRWKVLTGVKSVQPEGADM